MIPLNGTFWQNTTTKAVVEVNDRVQDDATDETVLIHVEVPGTGPLRSFERRCTPISKFLKTHIEVQRTFGWTPTNDRTDR